MDAQQEYYISLVKRLRNLPNEREWLEFKVDNNDPKIIGEYISALSNSASICDKDKRISFGGLKIEHMTLLVLNLSLNNLRLVMRN